MAIDGLIAALGGGIADLFGATAVGADVATGLTAAGDVAAADAAAAGVAGAGIADVASLTPEALAGLTTEVPAAGIADIGAIGDTAALTTIPATAGELAAAEAPTLDIGPGVTSAALENLGSPNTTAFNALNYAATPAQSAVEAQGQGLANAVSAGAPDTSSAAAAASTPVTSPAQELATGNPQLQAQLGGATAMDATPPPAAGPTATQTAMAGQTIPYQSSPFGVSSTAPFDPGYVLNNAPANPTSPSLTSQVGDVLNSPWTKAAELGLPLGMIGYQALKGPAPIPPQAQAAEQNAINQLAPLQGQAQQNVPLYNQTAANDLNLADNFKISPAQAASIQTYIQNSQNQLYQQLANEGNTNPMQTSQWVQGNNQIQQQALGMQVQMVNQLISTAFQAASAANAGVSTATNVTNALDSTFMQAAQLQAQQDQQFQQAISAAMQSFGMMAALSNIKVNVPASNPVG